MDFFNSGGYSNTSVDLEKEHLNLLGFKRDFERLMNVVKSGKTLKDAIKDCEEQISANNKDFDKIEKPIIELSHKLDDSSLSDKERNKIKFEYFKLKDQWSELSQVRNKIFDNKEFYEDLDNNNYSASRFIEKLKKYMK